MLNFIKEEEVGEWVIEDKVEEENKKAKKEADTKRMQYDMIIQKVSLGKKTDASKAREIECGGELISVSQKSYFKIIFGVAPRKMRKAQISKLVIGN